MNIPTKSAPFLLFTITAAFLVQCNKNESSSKMEIGVIAPLTGEGASYGQSMKRGFDLAFEGSNISLIYEDTQMLPKEAVSSAKKLIDIHKVPVILGEAASGVTMAVAPVAEQNKVILFSSISSTDKLRAAGDYIFRNVPRNEIQGMTAADLLVNKLGLRKISVVAENDEYGQNLTKSFKKRLKELGAEVVAEESYASDITDFRTVVEKLTAAGAEAVFNPGNYEETALLAKHLRESGSEIPLVGGDGSYSPELIRQAGTAAEGIYCTVMAANEASAFYKYFKVAFMKKYNKEPDVYDAYAFEAATIIRNALEAVGSDSAAIKDYLYETPFDSLTGELKFDGDGEVSRDYGVAKVSEGKFVNVPTQ